MEIKAAIFWTYNIVVNMFPGKYNEHILHPHLPGPPRVAIILHHPQQRSVSCRLQHAAAGGFSWQRWWEGAASAQKVKGHWPAGSNRIVF